MEIIDAFVSFGRGFVIAYDIFVIDDFVVDAHPFGLRTYENAVFKGAITDLIGYFHNGRERIELDNDVLIRPCAVICAAVFKVNCGFPFFGRVLDVVDCEMVIIAVNGVVCPIFLYVVKVQPCDLFGSFIFDKIFVEKPNRIDRFELDCVFALFKSRKGEDVKARVVDRNACLPFDFNVIAVNLFVKGIEILDVAASVVVIENRFEFYGVGIKIRDLDAAVFVNNVFGKESNFVQCRGLGVVDTAAEYRQCVSADFINVCILYAICSVDFKRTRRFAVNFRVSQTVVNNRNVKPAEITRRRVIVFCSEWLHRYALQTYRITQVTKLFCGIIASFVCFCGAVRNCACAAICLE